MYSAAIDLALLTVCAILLMGATLFAFMWWKQARYREALWLALALLLFAIGDSGLATVNWVGQRFLLNDSDAWAWYEALSRFAFVFTLMGAALLPYAFWRLWKRALRIQDEQTALEAAHE